MSEQILKPIQEATYLTVTNAWRYRSILRYFYLQHERLRHYLVLEEIYLQLRENPHFRDYSEEQLQQDLDQLVSWKNLIPRQDAGRVTSIEEFKKRKFRYQLTPYTIEIERMVLGLEQLGDGFGGSLERTLFDRLLENLLKLTSSTGQQDPETYQMIRDRENALKDYVLDKLGYHLIVHRHFAKLEKIPAIPEAWMGIETFQSPRDYAVL